MLILKRIKLFSSKSKKKSKVDDALIATGTTIGVGGGVLSLATRKKNKEGKKAVKDAAWEIKDAKDRLHSLEKEKRNITNLNKIVTDPELNKVVGDGKSIISDIINSPEIQNAKNVITSPETHTAVKDISEKVIDKGKSILNNIENPRIIEAIEKGKQLAEDSKPIVEKITEGAKQVSEAAAQSAKPKGLVGTILDLGNRGANFINKKAQEAKEAYETRLPEIEKQIPKVSEEIKNHIANHESILQKYKNTFRKNKAGKILLGTGLATAGIGSGVKLHKKKKEKQFSKTNSKRKRLTAEEEEVKNQNGVINDSDKMIAAGKIGLGIGAAGLGSAGYHAIRGIHQLGSGALELKDATAETRNSPGLRKVVSEVIDKHAPFGTGDMIKDAISDVSNIKGKMTGSTVGKIELGSKIAKWGTKLPRWATNNAHILIDKLSREGKELGRNKLNKQELKILDSFAPAAKKIGKGLTFLRNSKFLGKIGAGVGAASGALYVNGRMLKSSDRNYLATQEGNKIKENNK